MVTVVLALMTPHSQHDYIRITESFRADSLGLDHIIERLRAQIDSNLPDIIAHYLTACKQSGRPVVGDEPG
jgi:hypothetical protein